MLLILIHIMFYLINQLIKAMSYIYDRPKKRFDWVQSVAETLPSKHETLNQCWVDVGPSPTTLGQRQPSIGSTYRVCWVSFKFCFTNDGANATRSDHLWFIEEIYPGYIACVCLATIKSPSRSRAPSRSS